MHVWKLDIRVVSSTHVKNSPILTPYFILGNNTDNERCKLKLGREESHPLTNK
jgi:hypothetical protein